MKLIKLFTLTTALIALTACGNNQKEQTNSSTSQEESVVSVESSKDLVTSSEEEKDFTVGAITFDCDSFEGEYHDSVYIGKEYKVILTIKDNEGNDITANEKVECALTVRDGSTDMTGTWADVTKGEKAGEFVITPKSKGLDKRFDLSARYGKIGGTYMSRNYSHTVAIYSAPEE